jgi:hypothetical protein
MPDPDVVTASMRHHGERRTVLVCRPGADLAAAAVRGAEAGAALVYGFASLADIAAEGWLSLGPVPELVRPLRLAYVLPALVRASTPRVPLLAPFGRKARAAVREITSLPADVRITRLWDRFSVDVGAALERTTALFAWRIHARTETPYRTFILEDGDRYAIRAMCIFVVATEGEHTLGTVVELLHDRSVTGMRAASHLLGLALRAMSDAGAVAARALSLPHSGSYPIFARHAFFAARSTARPPRELLVHVLDPAVEDTVQARDRWYLSYLDVIEK